MDHFIKDIEIKNFKSIRELKLTGFKRINLFIGRPNVGKSNLLEALGLFSLPYVWQGSKNISELVRLTNIREIFYEGMIRNNVKIMVRRNVNYNGYSNVQPIGIQIEFNRELNSLYIKFYPPSVFDFEDVLSFKERVEIFGIEVDSKLKLKKTSRSTGVNYLLSNIKSYRFDANVHFKDYEASFLYPPLGNNLLNTLQIMPELRQIFTHWFKQYGLRLVLDESSQSLKIQKEKGNDEVFQLPYSSVADTLQRIIFYKTAVASNENSVLLFEEPEAHAYPPYISEFTWEVIKSKTNQTFIITHSPLVVEQFLSDALDDLAIFMVDFEDGQTVVKPLTTEEIKEVYRYGVDLFFNGESYTK